MKFMYMNKFQGFPISEYPYSSKKFSIILSRKTKNDYLSFIIRQYVFIVKSFEINF